ncbi:phosphotransferase [Candidatus Vidania fulgoroideae]|nr:phosphotransferase [Candidatus Vidania fulgoroideae]
MGKFVLTLVTVNPKFFAIYSLLTSCNFGYRYYPAVATDIYGRMFFYYNKCIGFLTAYVVTGTSYVFGSYCCYLLGGALSNLHLNYIARSVYIFNNFSFRRLIFDYIYVFWGVMAVLYYRFLVVAISCLHQFLISFAYLQLPVSFCHCDLFRDNVIFDSTACYKLIDFHFLSFEKKLYDLVIFINEWCFNGRFIHKRFIYFIVGYLRSCFISICEFDCLYIFILFITFRFFVTRLSTKFYGRYIFSNRKIYGYYYLYSYFYFNRVAIISFFSLLKRYIYVRFYKRLCFCALKGENQVCF